jgi:hypothetical protein
MEIDAEELAHALVKGAVTGQIAEVVAIRQFSLAGEVADLVEDATEDDDAADGVARGTEGKGHEAS